MGQLPEVSLSREIFHNVMKILCLLLNRNYDKHHMTILKYFQDQMPVDGREAERLAMFHNRTHITDCIKCIRNS